MDINKPRTLLVSSYIDTGANSFREQHAAAMASRLYYSDGAAKNGFTYDKHGLTVSGVARESSEMIKDTLKSIKKGRVWDKEKLKKSWVTAQLKHYGLLSTGGTNDALRSRLEAAANEGKVRQEYANSSVVTDVWFSVIRSPRPCKRLRRHYKLNGYQSLRHTNRKSRSVSLQSRTGKTKSSRN